MALTHLSALRQAAPGSPSMREIARRMKCSVEAVRRFEGGSQPLGPDRLTLYAKTIGAPEATVRRLFELTALKYHRACVVEILASLKPQSAKPRQRRVLQTA